MFRKPATWPLWRESRPTIALILFVELSALVLPAAFSKPFSHSAIAVSAGLASLSIAYSALTRRSERARWTLHQDVDAAKYQNLLAIWGFAGAVLLPTPLIWALVVIAAVAEWPRRNVAGHVRLYRYVYSGACAVLSAEVAHAVSTAMGMTWIGVAAAVPAYMFVGLATVTAAMLVAGEGQAVRGLLQLTAHRVEICTLAMAVGIVALTTYGFSTLVWLSLPAAIGLQRLTTRDRIRQATEEAQVEPMSDEAWLIAAREVTAALPVVSILRVESNTPAAVSAIAQLQLGCDAIGYIGSDSLGMLLVDCPALSAESMAARLRTALQEKGVIAGVSAAGKPRDGQSIADLLAVCEAELIARDAVSRPASAFRPDA